MMVMLSFILLITLSTTVKSFLSPLQHTPRKVGNGLINRIASCTLHAGKETDEDPNNDNDPDPKEMTAPSEDEILLRLNLQVLDAVEGDKAFAAVSKYCQSFPFAVVLPVQPLQYLPTASGGVAVKFLRKKTDIKSGVDGGIEFEVTTVDEPISGSNGDDEDDVEPNDTNDDDDTLDAPATLIQVTARRNAEGQVIRKHMAEKLVVTSFVAGLTGEKSLGKPPQDMVLLKSVFHKWM